MDTVHNTDNNNYYSTIPLFLFYYSSGSNINTSPTIQSVTCDADDQSYYFSSCTFSFGLSCATLNSLAGAICVLDTGRNILLIHIIVNCML